MCYLESAESNDLCIEVSGVSGEQMVWLGELGSQDGSAALTHYLLQSSTTLDTGAAS